MVIGPHDLHLSSGVWQGAPSVHVFVGGRGLLRILALLRWNGGQLVSGPLGSFVVVGTPFNGCTCEECVLALVVEARVLVQCPWVPKHVWAVLPSTIHLQRSFPLEGRSSCWQKRQRHSWREHSNLVARWEKYLAGGDDTVLAWGRFSRMGWQCALGGINKPVIFFFCSLEKFTFLDEWLLGNAEESYLCWDLNGGHSWMVVVASTFFLDLIFLLKFPCTWACVHFLGPDTHKDSFGWMLLSYSALLTVHVCAQSLCPLCGHGSKNEGEANE